MNRDNKAIVITGIISGVILIVALVFLLGNSVSSPSSENSITVQGVSTLKVMPDLVSINFNIETRANTSSEAKEKNSEILNNLIDSLVLEGFNREDIVTENFNVYQDYIWEDGNRKDKGFVANHYVVVEVSSDELDKLGLIVDTGVDAGALVNSIDFKLSQELQNEYKAEAMKLAAEDAKIKAEAVAIGFDKKVGRLVNAQVSDFNYYPWNVYSKAYGGAVDEMVVRDVASNIQPGEKEVGASISATYQLK